MFDFVSRKSFFESVSELLVQTNTVKASGHQAMFIFLREVSGKILSMFDAVADHTVFRNTQRRDFVAVLTFDFRNFGVRRFKELLRSCRIEPIAGSRSLEIYVEFRFLSKFRQALV